jgi:hypothetical protein
MQLPAFVAYIAVLVGTSLADDGLYHPQSYAGFQGSGNGNANANSPTAVASINTFTAATTISAKAQATSAATAAPVNWQTQVTWPAGCESWANPCPPGAIIVGGSTAGGSRTEVPASAGTLKAASAVASGSTTKIGPGASSTLSTLVRGQNSTYASPTRSSTGSGFSQSTGTSRPLMSNDGVSMAGNVGLAAFVAFVAAVTMF